jgi:hypothetical protein
MDKAVRVVTAGFAVALVILSLQSAVKAQNCAVFPKGPERAQCVIVVGPRQ